MVLRTPSPDPTSILVLLLHSSFSCVSSLLFLFLSFFPLCLPLSSSTFLCLLVCRLAKCLVLLVVPDIIFLDVQCYVSGRIPSIARRCYLFLLYNRNYTIPTSLLPLPTLLSLSLPNMMYPTSCVVISHFLSLGRLVNHLSFFQQFM